MSTLHASKSQGEQQAKSVRGSWSPRHRRNELTHRARSPNQAELATWPCIPSLQRCHCKTHFSKRSMQCKRFDQSIDTCAKAW